MRGVWDLLCNIYFHFPYQDHVVCEVPLVIYNEIRGHMILTVFKSAIFDCSSHPRESKLVSNIGFRTYFSRPNTYSSFTLPNDRE